MRGTTLARLVVAGTAVLATAACVAPPLTHPLLLAGSQDATAEIQALLGTPPPVEKDSAKLVDTIADALDDAHRRLRDPSCRRGHLAGARLTDHGGHRAPHAVRRLGGGHLVRPDAHRRRPDRLHGGPGHQAAASASAGQRRPLRLGEQRGQSGQQSLHTRGEAVDILVRRVEAGHPPHLLAGGIPVVER